VKAPPAPAHQPADQNVREQDGVNRLVAKDDSDLQELCSNGLLQQCGDLLASLAHLGGEIAQEQLARRAGSHLSTLH
jgi:hypothetical protein